MRSNAKAFLRALERCLSIPPSAATQQAIAKIVAACISRVRQFPWRETQDQRSEFNDAVELLNYIAQVAPKESVRFISIALAAMVCDIAANTDLLLLENSAALISMLQLALSRSASNGELPAEFAELFHVIYGVMEQWPLLAMRIVDLQVRFANSPAIL